ncbi:MAG: N-acetylneuraminate synthase family protein [Spirochaetota bacterium]|nr:N-acetylneuraminate synthase family protein [Spirochaetota bacterium]
MKVFNDIFMGRELIFIAEIGLNHNGDPDIAARMITEAYNAGADAVKFQTFVPEYMYSVYSNSLIEYGCEKAGDPQNIDFFRKFVLDKDVYVKLMRQTENLGMEFFSSPFDVDSVDFLEDIGIRIYKIASSEVTNHFLLKRIAYTKKPVIMSTGISTEDEISMAIDLLRSSGTPDVVLMHCVSLYPLSSEKVNLKRIVSLKKRFNLNVGFSDHTKEIFATQAAVMLGARIFEKHFTIDRDYECPDKNISLTQSEFKKMRQSVEVNMSMLGDGEIDYDIIEEITAKSARKSLFARRHIPKGKQIELDDIIPKRPGIGIPVYKMNSIIGKKCKNNIEEDFLLREEYLQ